MRNDQECKDHEKSKLMTLHDARRADIEVCMYEYISRCLDIIFASE